jgi:hypothetical protein
MSITGVFRLQSLDDSCDRGDQHEAAGAQKDGLRTQAYG